MNLTTFLKEDILWLPQDQLQPDNNCGTTDLILISKHYTHPKAPI